jgi:hypothetical protein
MPISILQGQPPMKEKAKGFQMIDSVEKKASKFKYLV